MSTIREMLHSIQEIQDWESVSQSELRRAMDLLCCELLGDFPFATGHDKTNGLALMLHPIVRMMIRGDAPLYVIDAPTPRTGKGLAFDALVAPGNGIGAGRTGVLFAGEPSSDAEWEKALVAFLRDAPMVLCFDNINHKVSSGNLAQVLTSWPYYNARVLGHSEHVRIPLNCAFVVTANNFRATDEISKRSLVIRLDAQMENPEVGRKFRHPQLRDWIAENIGELNYAAMVLAKNWICEGMPTDNALADRFGGFEQWIGVMGGIMKAARTKVNGVEHNGARGGDTARGRQEVWSGRYGLGDLLGNRMDTLAEIDEDNRAFNDVVALWLAGDRGQNGLMRPGGVKASELNTLDNADELFGTSWATDAAKVIGRVLRSWEGRIMHGHKLASRRLHGAKLWYLQPVDGAASGAGVGGVGDKAVEKDGDDG